MGLHSSSTGLAVELHRACIIAELGTCILVALALHSSCAHCSLHCICTCIALCSVSVGLLGQCIYRRVCGIFGGLFHLQALCRHMLYLGLCDHRPCAATCWRSAVRMQALCSNMSKKCNVFVEVSFAGSKPTWTPPLMYTSWRDVLRVESLDSACRLH